MKVSEIFESDGPLPLKDKLLQAALDILTPLVGQGVPFVTVQQIIDHLQDVRSGLVIDRSLVMDLVDPDQNKLVVKIEGDRIYLTDPNENKDDDKSNQSDAQRDVDKVKNTAMKQAGKTVAGS